MACNLGAIVIAAGYPIGRREREAIRRGIQALNRGEAVTDPLGRDELRRPIKA